MKKIKGVKRYAKQYLSAIGLNGAPQGIEQLSAVAGLMEKDKTFKTLMVSPVFTDEENRRIIAFLGRKLKMADATARYLRYLAESRALVALPEIVKSIAALYLEMKKRSKVIVRTPVKINKAYEESLIGSLKRLTGRDVDLEFVMDPALLGGIRLQVGSTMYDGSIKGQLGLLKDKLIKG